MVDIGGGGIAAISNLVSVRPANLNTADGAAQTANTLRATVGQLVQGTIQGMTRDGEPLLKSDQGDMALKLPFHVASGVDVVMRMEQASNGLRARILSINGMPLKDFSAQTAPAPTQDDIVQVPTPQTRTTANASPVSDALLRGAQSGLVANEGNPVSAFGQRNLRADGTTDAASLAHRIRISSDPVIALLLSRGSGLSEVLQKLPASLPTPPRVDAGTQLRIELSLPTVAGEASPDAAPPSASGAAGASIAAPAPATPTPTAFAFGQLLERMRAVVSAQQSQPPASPIAPSAAPLAAATSSLQNTVATLSAQQSAPDDLAQALQSLPTPPAPPPAAPPAAPTLPQHRMETQPDALMFVAQVIDEEPDGQLLLHTPLGVVRTPPPPHMPHLAEGTQLIVRLTGMLPPTATASADAADPMLGSHALSGHTLGGLGRLLQLAEGWDTLEHLDAVLRSPSAATQAASALAAHGLQALPNLPRADSKLGASLLFLLAALRKGDPMPWLGRDAVSHLIERGRQDLLGTLEQDFSLLRQPLTEPLSPNWQGFFFPVWVDGQAQHARLFVNRDGQEGGNAASGQKHGGDVRFVVEVGLSALGDMQLCGLVRKPQPTSNQPAPTHFDLMVRSRLPLAIPIQQHIRSIFTEGAAATGYQGQIIFQHTPDFPENPLESFQPTAAGMMA